MRKAIHRVRVTAGLLLMLGAGCRSSDKSQSHESLTRKECNQPARECYESCVKRDEGLACGGCCSDQRHLCDTLQPYAFDSCESINTRQEPR
jgi:hypothetical protein